MSLKFDKTETPLANILHGKIIAVFIEGKIIAVFIEVTPNLSLANAITM